MGLLNSKNMQVLGLVLVGALSIEWTKLYLIVFEGMQLKFLVV